MKSIQKIVREAPVHWVGDGLPVRSMFSYAEGSLYDPFLLLDCGDPHEFAPAEKPRGVGEHPHRGFETVTIMYQGELAHRDSSGAQGTIGPGDVQWMTAASGVVHEEFHSERFTREGGMLEMAQLWVNLPAKDKMTAPRYQEIQAAKIPRLPIGDGAGAVRVVAGEFENARGPAKTFTKLSVLDIQFTSAGAVELPAPEGHTAILIVQHGALSVGSENLKGVELALFERNGAGVIVRCDSACRALFLTGEPIGEPVVGYGPFVMNTREEIQQAARDYQEGRFGRMKAE